MRKHLWLLVGLGIPASLLAQEITNAPAAPRPARTAAAELRSTPLRPGPATVVARNVNVRGRPGLKGEVVARVTRGDQVTVLEEVILSRSAADEPSAWAKIVLPPSARVWVHVDFINKANNTVIPRRLNLRGGPGENYSVLGLLERGDSVQPRRTEGDWMEIEHPAGAYAFVAAQYLEQAAPTTTVATTEIKPAEPATTVDPATTTEPPVTPVTVAEGPDVKPGEAVTPPVTSGTGTGAPVETATTSESTWSDTNEVTKAAEPETPLPPRIVKREGVVRGTISIQAPTRFELYSPESGKVINYLYATTAALDLARYKGMRIIVTGEEALDERWRNTPVITIQRIDVLE